ncbi:1,6-anhydro-N-acetylmuramyl-L-alanine amidase AmpD [Thiolapillus sp.]
MKSLSPVWLKNIRHCPSPNCDERPDHARVDLLVIHNISLPPAQFGGPWIEDFFLNRLDASKDAYFQKISHLRVSAHFLIRRDGEILQFVPLDKRAWHAGESCFQGQYRCNDFSVGIELEGTDDVAYTDIQYQQLARLSRDIMEACPGITPERIAGHEHIAPGRKTDPGPAFDWPRYLALLNAS